LVPAVEVLVNTGRVAERIADPQTTAEIHDVIAEGGYYGMRTFDQSLLELVLQQRVEVKEALQASTRPHDFQLMLQQAGALDAGATLQR
jgi:twitching motility protein PilT